MADSRKYDIAVVAKATFVEDQSDPSQNKYMFAYTLNVTNTGTMPAQLISRHWIITDANAKVLEVKGLGVVGQQPLLKPGETFEYTSGTPLQTPSGIMVGSYEMETRGGDSFWVRVPAFSLDSPHQAVRLN